jgi:hypothetical protein
LEDSFQQHNRLKSDKRIASDVRSGSEPKFVKGGEIEPIRHAGARQSKQDIRIESGLVGDQADFSERRAIL